MTKLWFVIFLSGFNFAFAQIPSEEAINHAKALYIEDKEEEAYQEFSQMIEAMTLEEKNERFDLIFWHLMAHMSSADMNEQELKKIMQHIEVVLDSVPQDTQLYQSISLYKRMVKVFLPYIAKGESALRQALEQFKTQLLQEMIGDSRLQGRELREKVYQQVQDDQEVADRFKVMVLTIVIPHPDVLLGQLPATVKIHPLGNNDSELTVEVQYEYVLVNQKGQFIPYCDCVEGACL